MTVKNWKELLENARTAKLRKARKIGIELVEKAVESADPLSAVRRHVRVEGEWLRIGEKEFDLSKIGDIVVVGGGKASGAMVEALEGVLGDRITGGVVNVPTSREFKYRTRRVRLNEAGHPIPTDGSMRGAEEMIALVSDLGPNDLVMCLISGGGSSLISLPTEDITLDEVKETTQLLLKSGATIQEVNTVRKHISRIKGGLLAKAAYPATVISLIISDVVGDRLDTIASGPTVPDQTTYSDALSILEKYKLTEKVATKIFEHIKKGVDGEIPETPKHNDECFRNAFCKIIASNADALEAAAKVGKSYGLGIHILTTEMQGEARRVGEYMSHLAEDVRKIGSPIPTPALLLSGGETTVTVKGKGIGGRNQELVLSTALGINGAENTAIVSFSTDGIDGPTDAAGAIADGFTLQRANEIGLTPSHHLDNNDSYHFFEELNDLLFTGPTGTNVADVTALVVL